MDRELIIPVRGDVKADFHPNVIRNPNTPGGRIATEALTGIYESLGKLNDTEKEVREKVALAQAAKPLVERAVKRAREQILQLGLQIEKHGQDLQVKLTTGRNNPQAAEIRRHFKENKGNFIEAQALVNTGDRESVAALLGAPHWLSGMTPEAHASLRKYAAQKFEPDTLANLETAEDAIGRVMRAAHEFETLTAKKMAEWAKHDDTKHLERLK